MSRGESTSLAGRQVGLAGRQVGLAARQAGLAGRPEPVPVGFRGDVSISRQTMLLRGGATLMMSSRDSHGMPPPPARWTEAGVWGVVVRAEGWDESTHMLEAFVLTGSVGRLFLQVLLVVASARPQACYGPSTSLLFGV